MAFNWWNSKPNDDAISSVQVNVLNLGLFKTVKITQVSNLLQQKETLIKKLTLVLLT